MVPTTRTGEDGRVEDLIAQGQCEPGHLFGFESEVGP
jgi:hypothetical protein